MVAGAVALSLVAVVAGTSVAAPGSDALGSLLLMSLGGTVLGYLFWNAGIARLGASRTAVFLNLVPVSSMVISAFEGQPPTWEQLTGGAIVIAAVSLATLGPTARGPATARPSVAHCCAGSTAKSALLKRPQGRLTARSLRPEP